MRYAFHAVLRIALVLAVHLDSSLTNARSSSPFETASQRALVLAIRSTSSLQTAQSPPIIPIASISKNYSHKSSRLCRTSGATHTLRASTVLVVMCVYWRYIYSCGHKYDDIDECGAGRALGHCPRAGNNMTRTFNYKCRRCRR